MLCNYLVKDICLILEKKNSSETITLTASELSFVVVKIVILMYYPDIIYSVCFLFIDRKLSPDPDSAEIKENAHRCTPRPGVCVCLCALRAVLAWRLWGSLSPIQLLLHFPRDSEIRLLCTMNSKPAAAHVQSKGLVDAPDSSTHRPIQAKTQTSLQCYSRETGTRV